MAVLKAEVIHGTGTGDVSQAVLHIEDDPGPDQKPEGHGCGHNSRGGSLTNEGLVGANRYQLVNFISFNLTFSHSITITN
jgi:hypothetical protein